MVASLLLGCGRRLAAETGSMDTSPLDFAHLSVGSGYGLNYGGIGLGCEFNPRLPERFGTAFHRYFSLGLGLGFLPAGGLAYSFAIRAYPMGRNRFLQPRLSLQYGVVALAKEHYSGDERRAEGAAFSAGFLLRLAGRIFFDADIHIILPVEYGLDEIDGGRVRFSTGLRYRL